MMHLKFKPVAFLLPLVLWALALRLAWFRRWIAGSGVKRVFVFVCATVIALPVVMEVSSLYTERMTLAYADTIIAISAAYLHGQPMFPTLNGPTEYGLVYGPVTYLVYLPVLLPGVVREWVLQAWVMLALALVPGVFWYAMRKTCGRVASVTAVALLMAYAGMNIEWVWVIKGDVWILLFSVLGIWAAQRLDGWKAALLVAVAGAAMVDLKASTAVAAMLPCLLLVEKGDRRRWSLAAWGAVLELVLAASVFLLPGVSLANYRALLAAGATVGLQGKLLKGNVSFGLPMLVPMALLLWMGRRYAPDALRAWWSRRRYFVVGMLVEFVLACVTGAKVGGGAWHLFPVMAALGFATGELAELVWSKSTSAALLSQTAGLLCVGVVVMLAASGVHDTLLGTLRELRPVPGTSGVPPRLAEAEVLQIMREHPGVVLQMGVSDVQHFDLTYVRPLLQMAGQPLILDPEARLEKDFEWLPESDGMLEMVRSCKVGLWLIPKGGEPFSAESLYATINHAGEPMMYPDSFRSAFAESYKPVDRSYNYYELWGCKKGM